jgi:hypothetical protein
MTPKVKGSHPWALILCNASDQDAPGWPGLDYFNAFIAEPGGNGLYTWWQQVSGGNLDLAGSKVFGWYRAIADTETPKLSRLAARPRREQS